MSSGIYIHVPFCHRRCTYCDFYLTTNTKLTDIFIKSLVKEFELVSKSLENKDIDSVFLGGGTPSILNKQQLSAVFSALKNYFNLSGESEITIECNPEDISKDTEKLEYFRNCGINRISIGTQSFINNELYFLTREHTEEDSVKAVRNAKNIFDNVSVDLIYSIPAQTEKSLMYNLDKIIELDIPHVSAYTLIFEEGTLLHKAYSKKKINKNTDAKESELYFLVNNYLASKGYMHYEVSNYAKPGFESKHNLKYWEFKDYIGFGPSAHSFCNKKRWNNVKSVTKYSEMLEKNLLPVEFSEIPDAVKMENDYFISVMRSKGVCFEDYSRLFGKNFEEVFENAVAANIKNGYAKIENGRFGLTDKGFALADTILLDFVN
ncbi:MAG: radical SAM family heme chaperone HemW [Ignavibacteria bacterium]|nr:radical SAM family heme chaperone HemW [Ignavibacteria bacterium]